MLPIVVYEFGKKYLRDLGDFDDFCHNAGSDTSCLNFYSVIFEGTASNGFLQLGLMIMPRRPIRSPMDFTAVQTGEKAKLKRKAGISLYSVS
jgi:hypothetical protein